MWLFVRGYRREISLSDLTRDIATKRVGRITEINLTIGLSVFKWILQVEYDSIQCHTLCLMNWNSPTKWEWDLQSLSHDLPSKWKCERSRRYGDCPAVGELYNGFVGRTVKKWWQLVKIMAYVKFLTIPLSPFTNPREGSSVFSNKTWAFLLRLRISRVGQCLCRRLKDSGSPLSMARKIRTSPGNFESSLEFNSSTSLLLHSDDKELGLPVCKYFYRLNITNFQVSMTLITHLVYVFKITLFHNSPSNGFKDCSQPMIRISMSKNCC